MRSGRSVLSALVIGATLLVGSVGGLRAQEAAPVATPSPLATAPQPSYDVLRVEDGDAVFPYHVWFDWVPVLVTTPDGGAWAFFSAQARRPEGLGPRRLYAARFDPQRNVWLPAQALPGGDVQFLPAAAVDASGVVHVVYSNRSSDAADAFSTLLYTRSDGQGGWTSPVPVAPDPNAGHQMMPALAIDGKGVLHAIWRDQRLVTPEARAALAANADLFASDLVNGQWTAPVQVNNRPSADVNVAWSQLAVQGDRLVAVWSVYKGTTAEEMLNAVRVEWSTRPLDDPNEWEKPATLLDRENSEVGGRLIDLATDPSGSVILVHGEFTRPTNELSARRLDPGATTWGPDLPLGSGDYGYFPAIGVAPDGTVYVVFNVGRDRSVQIGGLVLRPGASAPEPMRILTPGEDGLQVRPAVAIGADGRPWVLYIYSPPGSNVATEIRVLRSADVSAP